MRLLKDHYDVRPEAFVVWYFLAMALSMPLSMVPTGIASWKDFAPTGLVWVAVLLGVTFGNLSNILFAQALVEAPHPSYPMAIGNLGPVIVAFTTLALAQFFPHFFSNPRIDAINLIAILMAVGGTAIFILRQG